MNIQSNIRVVKGLEESQIIYLKRDNEGQIVKIQAERQLLKYFNIFLGKSRFIELFLLYELKTGWCWSKCSQTNGEIEYIERDIESYLKELGYSKDDETVYTPDDIKKRLKCGHPKFTYFSGKIVVEFLLLGSSTQLYVRETTKEWYETKEQAYKNFIKNLKKRIQETQFLCIEKDWNHKASLKLHRDFCHPCTPWRISREAEIIEVKQRDAKWYLELEGINNQHATVVLNEDYEIFDVTRK
jgi:hypothetical protein